MSRASLATKLSLDRWAKILGINPVHFSGAVGSEIWPDNGACADIWPQHSWQTSDELVGREDVAIAILSAEEDIKNEAGYAVAPTWESEETHSWPRKMVYGNTFQTNYGYVIAGGVRAVTAIEEAADVVYSDPDNDGWDELATITVSTDLTDPREIKLYTTGFDGEPEWEIRPLKRVVISGGTATITADAWLMLDPELWERYPTNVGFAGIEITDTATRVTTVDVYREYNDVSQNGALFYQQAAGSNYCGFCSGGGCAVCATDSYGGCLGIVDARMGMVQPNAATYSNGQWTGYRPSNCRPVQRVSLNYLAGEVDKLYTQRRSLDPLTHHLAEAIVWLSVARLPKGICSCNNIRDKVNWLRTDATTLREPAANAALFGRFENMDVFRCPFGVRVGEVKAWQRVARLKDVIGAGGLL